MKKVQSDPMLIFLSGNQSLQWTSYYSECRVQNSVCETRLQNSVCETRFSYTAECKIVYVKLDFRIPEDGSEISQNLKINMLCRQEISWNTDLSELNEGDEVL